MMIYSGMLKPIFWPIIGVCFETYRYEFPFRHVVKLSQILTRAITRTVTTTATTYNRTHCMNFISANSFS